MNKKILTVLGILAFAGLVWAGTDLLVTGNLVVNGDSQIDGDILGGDNLSIANSGQFGGGVSALNYLGETIESHAFNGKSCDDACSKWTVLSYQCVEALNGSTSISCSTVSSGARLDCLCKS